MGGGITGAGIMLDAVTRGLKTALIEMQDFGAGTSSRSTKLIHGGLRYLKQLEFGLVKEVGMEREILFRNAPHIVIPEKMLLPIYKDGSLGKAGSSFGLWLYDRLAKVKPEERRKMLGKQQTIDAEPLLKKEGLKGGGLYYEYRTDDARLTLEVLKTAFAKGGLPVNYLKASNFGIEGGRVRSVKVADMLSGKKFEIRADQFVNAAGPWVDELRAIDKSLGGKHLHPTKGIHIVVSQQRFPISQALYFDANDGRMIFAIPRNEITYIGTTDTNYKGDLADPQASQEDVNYVLNSVNRLFPDVDLVIEDVQSSWAGVRPLIHEEGKSPSELSRKDELFESPSGLISIAGGKLTGYRKMAERVVDLVMKRSRKTWAPCMTDKVVLAGGECSRAELSDEIERISGEEQSRLSHLVDYYGTGFREVLEIAREIGGGEDSLLKAEVLYTHPE